MQPKEISVVKTVGEVMVSTLASIEKKMYSDQVAAMEALKPVSASVTDSLEALKSEEEAGE